MKTFCMTILMIMVGGALTAASNSGSDHSMHLKYEDLKWKKLVPELGDESSEVVILNVNPKTGATQLMIRASKNYHVPKHWHTANETIYVVDGNFVMQDQEGKVADLSPGSFIYMPSKMYHEGWSKSDQGYVLFINVDGPWDIFYTEGTPTAQQVKDVSKRPALPAPAKAPVKPSASR